MWGPCSVRRCGTPGSRRLTAAVLNRESRRGLRFVSGAELGCCGVDLFLGDVLAAGADRDDGGGGDDVCEGFEVAAGVPVQFDGVFAQGVFLWPVQAQVCLEVRQDFPEGFLVLGIQRQGALTLPYWRSRRTRNVSVRSSISVRVSVRESVLLCRLAKQVW